MNDTKNLFLTADSLRETLGYSASLYGKTICAVVDAEPFESYDYTQMAHDFLRISEGCDAKIVIVIGCFPTRIRKKKQAENLRRTSITLNKLEKSFAKAGAKFATVEGSDKLVETSLLKMLEKEPIVIVTSDSKNSSDCTDVCRALSLVSKSLEKTEIAKLLIISEHKGIYGANKQFLAQIHSGEIRKLENEKVITGELVFVAEAALFAIEKLGIKRVHIINGTKPDNLFVELFTKDGSGTMIYFGEYIDIRQAMQGDTSGIHALLSYHSEQDADSHSPNEETGEFLVATIDSYIVACAKVQFLPEENITLVTSLTIIPAYAEIGQKLLKKTLEFAHSKNSSNLFVIFFGAVPWWVQENFRDSEFSQLPEKLQTKYADKKSAKVLMAK